MEEKKLTDEDVIAAYGYCVIDNNDCENCPYDSWGCGIVAKDIFDIVNRQKAEIERLTEENGWLSKECNKSTVECAELQNQVDELTAKKNLSIANIEKELTHYLFMSCSYGALVCGKMSLSIAQEQAKRFAPFVYGFVQQAVKDTAKEIYGLAVDYYDGSEAFDLFLQAVKELYGVGVE